jgi:hypothetical protein
MSIHGPCRRHRTRPQGHSLTTDLRGNGSISTLEVTVQMRMICSLDISRTHSFIDDNMLTSRSSIREA